MSFDRWETYIAALRAQFYKQPSTTDRDFFRDFGTFGAFVASVQWSKNEKMSSVAAGLLRINATCADEA